MAPIIEQPQYTQKEEEKEMLANLLLEYKFGCLSEKHPKACDLLGDYYNQVLKDLPGALNIWKENCELRGFPKSCVSYGVRALKGQGGLKRNREEALVHLTKACDQDFAEGCYWLAIIYELGTKKREKDFVTSARLFEKACNLKEHEMACLGAYDHFYRGRPGVAQNCEKALKYAEMACNKLNFQACDRVIRMYELGDCTKVDIQKAAHYRKKLDDLLKDTKTPGVNMTG